MSRQRSINRNPGSAKISGLQIHLGYLCKYQWSHPVERPAVMAVRNEQDILDWVKRILEIRAMSAQAGFREYLDTENQLLELTRGSLPAAIQLRARWAYHNSPRVKVAEAVYAGAYAKDPSLILREFQEQTGWGPAAFEEKLEGEWLDHWEALKSKESSAREALSR